MERFLYIIKPGGSLFLVNPLGFSARNEADRLGITVSSLQVHSNGMLLAQASRLFDDRTIRIVIDSTYSLAEASAAHQRAMQGSVQGKVVLVVKE